MIVTPISSINELAFDFHSLQRLIYISNAFDTQIRMNRFTIFSELCIYMSKAETYNMMSREYHLTISVE